MDKKQEERHFLDRFKSFFDNFPQGDVECTEEPDFIVATPKHRLGIEVTKLYWTSEPGNLPRQAQESLHGQVANKAEQLHEKSDLPKCIVSVHFADRKLRKKDIEPAAMEVFNSVMSNIPSAESSAQLPPNGWTESGLPANISALSVYRTDNIEKTTYSAPQVGWIPDMNSKTDIQRVLDAKNPKALAYRKKCDELWLLINVAFGTISSQFDIPDEVVEEVVDANFDRVFLLSHSQEKVWELNIDT